MSEDHIKRMTLFFYYLFLEKPITLKASQKAIQMQKKLLAQNQTVQKQVDSYRKPLDTPLSLMVSTCLSVWKKYQKQGFHKKKVPSNGFYQVESQTEDFSCPVDLAPWCDFLKEAEDEVILVMIFSKILLLPDQDIARGMGISIGTVRYRLGSGLRLLGRMSPYGVTRL